MAAHEVSDDKRHTESFRRTVFVSFECLKFEKNQ
jgi:hypothetical protein